MSYQAQEYVLCHSRTKGTTRVILWAIARHANDSGEAWPSVKLLADYALVEERMVRNALRELEEIGEIQTLTQAAPSGHNGQKTNLYRVVMHGCTCPQENGRVNHRPIGKKGFAAMDEAKVRRLKEGAA